MGKKDKKKKNPSVQEKKKQKQQEKAKKVRVHEFAMFDYSALSMTQSRLWDDITMNLYMPYRCTHKITHMTPVCM
jgi:hypothetical protein